MGNLQHQNFATSDQVRTPPKSRVETVDLGGVKVARFTFQPGWRWSTDIKPVVGTETCQVRHVGAVVSGHIVIVNSDERMELGPGDAYTIEPGHDAWVEGDEPWVGYEFESVTAATFANPGRPG